MDDSNDYILSLYELKRSLVLKESTMQGYMLAAIGVSHGGKTTKIHAVVDALGNPAHFLLTGGNIFDASVAVDLLSEVKISGSNILGDKAYGTNFIRTYITEQRWYALRRIDSPYVAKLYESGSHNEYPVKILPFYERGSLQGHTFSEDEIVRMIISTPASPACKFEQCSGGWLHEQAARQREIQTVHRYP